MPVAALAQVSVNPGALDQLKPSAPSSPAAPAKPEHSRAPTRRAPASHPTRAAHPTQASEKPAPPQRPTRPKPVTVAPAPPPPAVLPPVVEMPHAAPPPPPPVPIVPDAVGAASPIPGGMRLTFGEGKADLNPTTDAALIKIAGQVKGDPAIDINVLAHATGNPDDPSTPRRLSLSRALAARAVLISEGIVSTRIYVRALGATSSDGPPDRVDVVTAGTPTPPASTPPAATPPAAAPAAPSPGAKR